MPKICKVTIVENQRKGESKMQTLHPGLRVKYDHIRIHICDINIHNSANHIRHPTQRMPNGH